MDARARVWEQCAADATQLIRLDVDASPVFIDGGTTFQTVTAVVGVHGAGKSYLLHMVESALPGWQVKYNLPPYGPEQFQLGGAYRLRLRNDDGAESTLDVSRPTASSTVKQQPGGWEVTYLSAFTVQSELDYFAQNYFNQTELTGLRRKLKVTDLDALAVITGHRYERLEYWDADSSVDWFPWIRGERNGRQVNSLTMSASEFWVHYILLIIREAGRGQIILIDEPETFLAPPGHRPFIDEIARLTLASGCQTIIATHSEAIIRRMPPSCLRLLTSTPGGTRIDTVSEAQSALRALTRSRSCITGLILVEDNFAASIVRAVLRRFASHRLEEYDVIATAGHGEVRAGVRVMSKSSRLRVVGVLDGDQYEPDLPPNLLLLPGGHPEEDVMTAMTLELESVASDLGVTPIQLRLAVEASRFTHHQHMFAQLALHLPGLSVERIQEVAIEQWMRDLKHAAHAEDLATAIEGCLS